MSPDQDEVPRAMGPRGGTSRPGPRAPRGRATGQSARARCYDLEVGVTFDAQSTLRNDLRESVLACHRAVRDAVNGLLERIVRLRGHDPAVCCRRELIGLLADLPLFELMPMIQMNRRSAIVDVRLGAEVSRLWCADGELIDASSGNLEGTPAAYRILALEQGELCVDYRPVNRPRLIRDDMQVVVMEAARRKDECAELAKWLGGPNRLWCVCPSPGARVLDENELLTLEALVHERTLGQVLARNCVGDLETLRAMTALAQRGYVRPRSTRSSSFPAPHPPALDDARSSDAPAASGTRPKKQRGPLVAAGALALALASLALHPDVPEPSGRAPVGTDFRALSPALTAGSDHEGAGPAYRVRVRVDPSDAALWLDGRRVATGYLDIDLTRDGQTHELLVAALGCRSQTYLFQDAPPPRLVVLDPAREAEQAMRSPVRAAPP